MSVPDEWVERARYDLDTARAMLDAERFLYVIFCCQQAVEKALKALILKRSGKTPPRLHNLPRLAEVAELEISTDRAEFLLWLTIAYVRSRYPTLPAGAHESPDRVVAARVLSRTEETCEWLLTLLA